MGFNKNKKGQFDAREIVQFLLILGVGIVVVGLIFAFGSRVQGDVKDTLDTSETKTQVNESITVINGTAVALTQTQGLSDLSIDTTTFVVLNFTETGQPPGGQLPIANENFTFDSNGATVTYIGQTLGGNHDNEQLNFTYTYTFTPNNNVNNIANNSLTGVLNLTAQLPTIGLIASAVVIILLVLLIAKVAGVKF